MKMMTKLSHNYAVGPAYGLLTNNPFSGVPTKMGEFDKTH